MMEKQKKKLREWQPLWAARRIRALSVAGVFILVGAAISGGVVTFTRQYKGLCPEGGECKTPAWHPGLLFLGIYALACATITLWKMIHAIRKREVCQPRTALVLFAVTFSLILAVWCTLLIDNSSYRRHEHWPSSDDLCEVHDYSLSSSTPSTEESSKWGPYEGGFANGGLTWETWNKGLTGGITNEGPRSGNGISRVVPPL